MDTSGFGQFSTSYVASTTTMSTVNPTAVTKLSLLAASITSYAAQETNSITLWNLSKSMRGVLASLTIIHEQQVMATATETLALSAATHAIMDASLNLKNLYDEANVYSENISLAGNAVFSIVYGLVLVLHACLLAWYQDWYFGVCFTLGTASEFAGYVGRAFGTALQTEFDPFLVQIICLTIAPAFIMAGIYYVLAQMVVAHDRIKCTRIPAMWYLYIFITCDVISLVIQAAGGGTAAVAVQQYENSDTGTYIMLAGICFQVVSMSLFLYFLFDFFVRAFFLDPAIPKTWSNFAAMLFATKRGVEMRKEMSRNYYDPAFAHLRNKSRLFYHLPIFILVGTLFVFARCIYRVVELAQGWTGYLITHEIYLFCLDGMLVWFTIVLFVMFYPPAIFGKNHGLNAAAIVKAEKLDAGNKLDDSNESSEDTRRENTEFSDAPYDRWDIEKRYESEGSATMHNNDREDREKRFDLE